MAPSDKIFACIAIKGSAVNEHFMFPGLPKVEVLLKRTVRNIGKIIGGIIDLFLRNVQIFQYLKDRFPLFRGRDNDQAFLVFRPLQVLRTDDMIRCDPRPCVRFPGAVQHTEGFDRNSADIHGHSVDPAVCAAAEQDDLFHFSFPEDAVHFIRIKSLF